MTIADALTQRGRWPDVADESGREILSWLVVASLLETHADLGVVETHPGHPGEYDCLSVYDRTRMDRGPILDLDRLAVDGENEIAAFQSGGVGGAFLLHFRNQRAGRMIDSGAAGGRAHAARIDQPLPVEAAHQLVMGVTAGQQGGG